MAKKYRILVVDDAAFTRDLVKRGVKSGYPGFHIDEAGNGRQAQSKIQNHSYDLILCDWEMPEMSGYEVLEWLRAESDRPDVPFIMVTSRGDRNHVVQALEIGATNYIIKPFTNDKLLNVITKALIQQGGATQAELREAAGAKPQAMGNDSASILTQGREQGKTEGRRGGGLSGDLASMAETVQTGTSGPRQVTLRKKRVVSQIRFAEARVACLLQELSDEQLVGVIKRGDFTPALFDQAAFDFQTEDEQVSRINAYVHALQAGEKSQTADFIKMTLRFTDDDDTKREHLSRYIESLGG